MEQAESHARDVIDREANWKGGAISAAWTSSPSTAKRRATSMTPCGWRSLPNGNYALHVHIADVSHYVRPGTPHRRRGAACAVPASISRTAPSPCCRFELSTNICSLNPQVGPVGALRAARDSTIRARWWARNSRQRVIRSVERMTYTNVHLLLERATPALRDALCKPLIEPFRVDAGTGAGAQQASACKRGSIDFDLPEPLIEFDQWGAMTGVARAPRNVAHRLIEEFMLAANEAVSRASGGAPGASPSSASTRCRTRRA